MLGGTLLSKSPLFAMLFANRAVEECSKAMFDPSSSE